MQITYTACDNCASKGATHCGLNVGHCTDAAGSSADISVDADLCVACKAILFETLLLTISTEVAEDFLRSLTAMGSMRKLFVEHR